LHLHQLPGKMTDKAYQWRSRRRKMGASTSGRRPWGRISTLFVVT